MRASVTVMSKRLCALCLQGFCASRVGAAQPMRTDVTPLDGPAFTQGWCSASLVTVEDEAPALDTVVVDPQGALDADVQVASESESAGVFTVAVSARSLCTRTQTPRRTPHVRTSTSTRVHEPLPCSILA